MYHAAEECAEGREQAFAASAAERACENVKHSWSGSDGEQNRGTQKNEKTCRVDRGLMEHDFVIVSAETGRG